MWYIKDSLKLEGTARKKIVFGIQKTLLKVLLEKTQKSMGEHLGRGEGPMEDGRGYGGARAKKATKI